MTTLNQKLNHADQYATKNFRKLLAIIATILIISTIVLDWYVGFALTNGLKIMTGQEVTLLKNEGAYVWTTNTGLINLSNQPVTVKSNFVTIAQLIMRSRPDKLFTIAFTENMITDVPMVSFITLQGNNRMFFVRSDKPTRGTIAVFYNLHYRELKTTDDKPLLSDTEAQGYAETRSIMWESIRYNRTFTEYQTALGSLSYFAQNLSEGSEKDQEEYLLYLKVFRGLRGPVE